MTIAGSGSMPEVSAVESAHSARLRAQMGARIDAAGGWVSFADYMRWALYEPGLGYYSAGAVKFGAAGDFITAPEMSPFFARACARFFDRVLRRLRSGEVLELGPGSGQFAWDALSELRGLQTPLQAYRMLEISADLRQVQQDKLREASSPAPVSWLDQLPPAFTGIIFGNEVIDAMPCERFMIRHGEFWRLGVGRASTPRAGRDTRLPQFEWRVRPPDGACADDEPFSARAARIKDWLQARGKWGTEAALPEGYCGEWHPDLRAWVRSIAQSLSQGAIVLADYGLPRQQLYLPDRIQGSLRCHQRHHAHVDPFLWPGLTDITAWVDFTELAEAALEEGLTLAQFTTQTAFLLGSGTSFTPRDPREAQGLRQLVLPGEMGEAIKFMVLTRHLDLNVVANESPFLEQDLRDSLLL